MSRKKKSLSVKCWPSCCCCCPRCRWCCGWCEVGWWWFIRFSWLWLETPLLLLLIPLLLLLLLLLVNPCGGTDGGTSLWASILGVTAVDDAVGGVKIGCVDEVLEPGRPTIPTPTEAAGCDKLDGGREGWLWLSVEIEKGEGRERIYDNAMKVNQGKIKKPINIFI